MEIVKAVASLGCLALSICAGIAAVSKADKGQYDRAAYYMAFAAWMGTSA